MAKDRVEPCKFYVCKDVCSKGRDANMTGYCQKCNKYEPRVRRKHLNEKKEKVNKINEKEFKRGDMNV